MQRQRTSSGARHTGVRAVVGASGSSFGHSHLGAPHRCWVLATNATFRNARPGTPRSRPRRPSSHRCAAVPTLPRGGGVPHLGRIAAPVSCRSAAPSPLGVSDSAAPVPTWKSESTTSSVWWWLLWFLFVVWFPVHNLYFSAWPLRPFHGLLRVVGWGVWCGSPVGAVRSAPGGVDLTVTSVVVS